MKICPVILSGGSGKRLWPLSRTFLPKQFLNLNSEVSLIIETVRRIENSRLETLDPLIVCNKEHQFLVSNQLDASNCSYTAIILEPTGKNTAPATTLAALALEKLYPNEDCLMLVMPADHKIDNVSEFISTIGSCLNAVNDSLFIFGVEPLSASSAFGYIEIDRTESKTNFEVLGFHEKPNSMKAKEYFEDANYLWNSGIFLFLKSFYLESIRKTDIDILEACKNSMIDFEIEKKIIKPNESSFNLCPSNSLDYALMERSFEHNIQVKMTPLRSDWNDLGTWQSLYESKEKDINNNVLEGDIIANKTFGSYVFSNDGLVAVNDLENTLVVKTQDALFISSIEDSNEVSQLVDKLTSSEREEADLHKEVHRPWGTYETVSEDATSKVKRIKVYPNSQLSLQLHHKRAEHWVVVQGEATVIKGNEKIILQVNESIYINLGEKHSLANNTENILEIIEVQIGDYLGEDDIVRFEDKYGRVDN